MEAQSMNEITREALFNQVRAWTLQAGAMIREKIYEPRTIDIKSNPKDLVTEMDREIEAFYANKIKSYYPHHYLLGQEGYGDKEIDRNKTDRKSTRLNSSHVAISYAVFCLKKKNR